MSETRLTFNRSDLRELLDISIPMVVSQGSFALMVFADRLFLSMIEPVYMAAAMGGGVASFFSIALFIGVMAYANALVAQYQGSGELHKCPRVVSQGCILALLCLPVIAAIAFFVDKLFAAMGHEPHQVALEQAYYRILMLGAMFNLGKACIGSYFSGIGRTRVVMIADLLGGVLLNIPLSYVLIFGKLGLPELGIQGAAWGTVIATLFSLLIFLGFYLSPRNRRKYRVLESFRFDAGIMRRYVRLGFPSGLEMFMNVATFNLFLLLFQSFGVTYGAAAAIVFNWDMVSFIPIIGLNIGVISLIGRYVGAQRHEPGQRGDDRGLRPGVGLLRRAGGHLCDFPYRLAQCVFELRGGFRTHSRNRQFHDDRTRLLHDGRCRHTHFRRSLARRRRHPLADDHFHLPALADADRTGGHDP